jgi:amino acid transporter
LEAVVLYLVLVTTQLSHQLLVLVAVLAQLMAVLTALVALLVVVAVVREQVEQVIHLAQVHHKEIMVAMVVDHLAVAQVAVAVLVL